MDKYEIQKPFGVIHYVVTDGNTNVLLSVGVFQRQRELLPSNGIVHNQ